MSIPISELWAQNDAGPEAMQALKASRIRKAGLHGSYATANSAEGQDVYTLTENGRGAYLWGEPGRGKTYIAAVAVRMAVEDGKSAKLLKTADFLDALKAEFDGATTDTMKNAKSYDLLVLDDLGLEAGTAFAKEKLTQLMDARVELGRPTVITSNLSLGEMRDMWGKLEGKRIASRIFGSCKIYEIPGKDRRLS